MSGSTGTNYDFGARIYDARLGRFLSVDPMTSRNSKETPFDFAGNNPVYYIDKEGEKKVTHLTIIQQDGTKVSLFKVDAKYVEWKWYQKTTNFGEDFEWRLWSQDVNQDITYDLRDNTTTSETTYTPRGWSDGETQPGGFFLTSKSGGIDPTKTLSLSDPEQRDIEDLLTALSALGKLKGQSEQNTILGQKPKFGGQQFKNGPMNFKIPDKIKDLAGIINKGLGLKKESGPKNDRGYYPHVDKEKGKAYETDDNGDTTFTYPNYTESKGTGHWGYPTENKKPISKKE